VRNLVKLTECRLKLLERQLVQPVLTGIAHTKRLKRQSLTGNLDEEYLLLLRMATMRVLQNG